MAYYTNLFSPETYETFSRSSRDISGFRIRQKSLAGRIVAGDRFICYMTKLSRWVGVLEIMDGPFEDDSPFYYPENDPFVIRFRVNPLVWLLKEQGIPIREDFLWDRLSFTTGLPKNSYRWTGKLRASLNLLNDEDGGLLEQALFEQMQTQRIYPVDEAEYQKWLTHQVSVGGKTVAVAVPEAIAKDEEAEEADISTVRESHQIQAAIARIGEQMGFKIWLPRADRAAILQIWGHDEALVETLPLNYDEATIRTIEQIDVLWMKNRYIARAFEVEHTTSIYSGLLRMADLLALQPNLDIQLHIVAPDSRREKVFQELRRPIFSLLDRAPLSERCSYISYESIKELEQQKNLKYMSDAVLEEYAEDA